MKWIVVSQQELMDAFRRYPILFYNNNAFYFIRAFLSGDRKTFPPVRLEFICTLVWQAMKKIDHLVRRI
jgi:hypothetical protein